MAPKYLCRIVIMPGLLVLVANGSVSSCVGLKPEGFGVFFGLAALGEYVSGNIKD